MNRDALDQQDRLARAFDRLKQVVAYRKLPQLPLWNRPRFHVLEEAGYKMLLYNHFEMDRVMGILFVPPGADFDRIATLALQDVEKR